MPIVFPLSAFALIMFCLVARGSGYRQALLAAAVCYGLLLTAATELLSRFSAVTGFTLAAFWGGVACLALLALLPAWDRQAVRGIRVEHPGLLAGIAAVLAITLLIALVAPPNNWDSMTYHMARVVHWIQNRSIAHYPTHITRQLYSAPWAEYAIMHLQVLGGGDRFVNLVQWFAMCGSIAGTSLIAREFGASSRSQALAAVVTLTLPLGILQSSSTQNDYVVSFWLVCFVYFGLLLVKTPHLLAAVAAGASLGLALLTKGTAYIFALPLLFWLLLAGLQTDRNRFWKHLLIAAVIVISLNAGHCWRNYTLWGTPLATDGDSLANERFSCRVTISNLARNIVSQTWTPLAAINGLQFQSVAALHETLGIGLSDPATTLNGQIFSPGKTSLDEDYAGNGLHLLLVLLAVAALAVRGKSLPWPLRSYALSLAGGFLLYCILLKWQPWGARLQLPLFVLAAPLITAAIPLEKMKAAVPVLAVFMFCCSVPWLMGNATRPLWGERSILTASRESLYFAKRPQLESYYRHYVDRYLNGASCNTIGITSPSGNAYEYPFWALLARRTATMPQIEHVNIDNISRSIPRRSFQPCFLFEIL